jgi:hypothetical protein
LDNPLPNLCPVIPTSNQDGRQANNRKKGDEIYHGHLGRCSEMPDTILEEDHPRIISAKFGRGFFKNFELLPISTDYAN